MVGEGLTDGVPRPGLDGIAVEHVFDRSTRAMFVADDARRYVDANQAALELTGFTRDELLARRIDDLMPPELRAGLPRRWEQFLRNGTTAQTMDLVVAGGRLVRVDLSSVANVGPGRHLSICVPVTGPGTTHPVTGTPPSRREREVLGLLALGLDGPEIAERLGLSPATVRTHVNNAMRKLGAHTRAHAIALSIRHGYVDV